jgi:hypothetical protein
MNKYIKENGTMELSKVKDDGKDQMDKIIQDNGN